MLTLLTDVAAVELVEACGQVEVYPDGRLLTDAAHRATELGDLALAERIARAAVAAGGGFEPRLLLGNALRWAGRGAEVDTELAALAALARWRSPADRFSSRLGGSASPLLDARIPAVGVHAARGPARRARDGR